MHDFCLHVSFLEVISVCKLLIKSCPSFCCRWLHYESVGFAFMSLSCTRGWVPGVLSEHQVNDLAKEGWLENFNLDDPISTDGSAFDLTIIGDGYRMLRGSVKPFGGSYEEDVLKNSKLAERIEPSNDGVFGLDDHQTYVFRIQQQLASPLLSSGLIYGQATAKSSIGRVDVLARLIVDGMDTYESFDPVEAAKQKGRMFIEVTPMTFKVRVKVGMALSQLRLFKGRPEDCEISGQVLYHSVLRRSSVAGASPYRRTAQDGSLSVDLDNALLCDGESGCAFRAKKASNPEGIALWEENEKPDPKTYWELWVCDESKGQKYLRIEKDHFYILRSRERIALPPGVAVYCRATDETIGEMRIHYAGFVHPNFGYERDDEFDGTPLIFEVKGHDFEVTLTNEEVMARLTFYRMSKDSEKASTYGKQTLQLSKFFKPWYH
jgi:dCTP deaminase